MKQCLELFWIFCKIGAFTMGGGYAMLPLIEQEIVDRRQWIDRKEFLDLVAVAQSAPGVMAVNMAIFVGYKLKGVLGSVVTTLGAALPSFVIILVIALFFHDFQQNPVVNRIFTGIRPAVVALIAAPVFNMGRSACPVKSLWGVSAASALLIWLFGVSPVYIILAAGLGGWAYGRWQQGGGA